MPTALASAAAIALEDGPFTAPQSSGGRALYAANCAGCHGAQLQGAGEAPAAGRHQLHGGLGQSLDRELYNLVKASMPYGNGNSLDAATYRSIIAYVLAANGAKPGNSCAGGQ